MDAATNGRNTSEALQESQEPAVDPNNPFAELYVPSQPARPAGSGAANPWAPAAPAAPAPGARSPAGAGLSGMSAPGSSLGGTSGLPGLGGLLGGMGGGMGAQMEQLLNDPGALDQMTAMMQDPTLQAMLQVAARKGVLVLCILLAG